MKLRLARLKGFTVVELVSILVILAALIAILLPRLMSWHDKAVVARNVSNVDALVLATTRFMLEGGTFSGLTADAEGKVPVEPIVAQLVAANKLAPAAITSRQVTVRFFADPDTRPSVADGLSGTLYFWPTKDD